MDNQDNNFKTIDLSNLPKTELLKDFKFDMTNMPTQSYQQQLNVKTPNYNLLKKEEPKPKTGIEGWYERNTGKITLFLAILSAVEGIIIFILSQ